MQGPGWFPEFLGIHKAWFLMKKFILKIPEISRQAVNMRSQCLFPLKFTLKQSTERARRGKEIFIDMSEQGGVPSICWTLGEFGWRHCLEQ